MKQIINNGKSFGIKSFKSLKFVKMMFLEFLFHLTNNSTIIESPLRNIFLCGFLTISIG